MITATPVALNKIKQNLSKRGKGVGILVGTTTRGCSGYAYVLEYLDSAEYTESVTDFIHESVVIRVSNKDLLLLDGMEIDYIRKGLNEGFEFNNPNEKDRCGCNESFRI